ncbi:MAG: enoyl-CoA hydratase-related protein [Polyangia bacterium]
MDNALVVTELRGTVLRIAFNRANKKNALTMAMYELLTAALAQAASDDKVRSVLFLGSPGVFTAGNDIGDFMQHPPTSEDTPVVRFLTALMSFDKPMVAAVDGPAVGIGTTMLLHCDVVLASDRARFHMPFTKLGLVPEAAASVLVPALVGRQRAAAWLMLSRPFDVKEAHAAGLVSRIVAEAELDAAAEEIGAEIAALPAEAVRLTRQLLKAGTASLVDEAMKRELVLFRERLTAPETMEAFMAFMSKR